MKYLFLIVPIIIGCAERTPGNFSTVKVHTGMHFDALVDTLVSKNIVESPVLLRLYARVTGDDRRIHAGEYSLQQYSHWKDALRTYTLTYLSLLYTKLGPSQDLDWKGIYSQTLTVFLKELCWKLFWKQ